MCRYACGGGGKEEGHVKRPRGDRGVDERRRAYLALLAYADPAVEVVQLSKKKKKRERSECEGSGRCE
jgi:hypothetical protein